MIAELDRAVDAAIAEHRIVGTVVLVSQHGETIYRRAAGFADRESARAMSEDALFQLASITKPYVTAATFATIDAGKLQLDDEIAKFLPEFVPRLPDGSTPPITIANLLTHTSGISYAFQEGGDGPYVRAGVSDGLGEPGVGTAEEVARIVSAGLKYAPGTTWHYSLSIDVLGFALERITNETLPRIVARSVTEPLGMRDTVFFTEPSERIVTPYFDGQPEPLRMDDPQLVRRPGMESGGATFAPSRAFRPDSFPSGGAGMLGTASDVLLFLNAMLAHGGGIVSPRSAEAMMCNQTGDLPIVFGPGWGFGYGGAILMDPIPAKTPQSSGTWQWGGAYGHNWFVDPARGLVAVALTNTAYEGMNGRYTREIRDAVYA